MTAAQILPWDTQFFGKRIARVSSEQISTEMMQEIDAWCAEEAVECLYYLADSADTGSIRVAEEADFRLQDIRVTFTQKRPAQPRQLSPGGRLRFGQPSDLDALLPIAGSAYSESRFFRDPGFGPEQSAALYEIWLRQSLLEDYAQAVFVAEHEDQAAAYITCDVDTATQAGKIGLMGVGEAARGQQFGTKLVLLALSWFWQQGMERVTVVTQGSNIPAQNLYQKCGFISESVRLWYHKWYRE